MTSAVTMDMVWSEDELRHAFHHLLKNPLKGNESLMVYRNARKKYSEAFRQSPLKHGIRATESFRSIDEGIIATYRPAVCFRGVEREASALYVTINPSNVPEALKATHERYYKWVEYQAGASKEKVKKGDRSDFAATLDMVLKMKMLTSCSRGPFSMIDIDDNDPTTWLGRIRQAIGDDAIEMILETKNGFHVVFLPKKMSQEGHKSLNAVLSSDPGKGQDASVTKGKGSKLSVALPGGLQADHETRILYCSCERPGAKPWKPGSEVSS